MSSFQDQFEEFVRNRSRSDNIVLGYDPAAAVPSRCDYSGLSYPQVPVTSTQSRNAVMDVAASNYLSNAPVAIEFRQPSKWKRPISKETIDLEVVTMSADAAKVKVKKYRLLKHVPLWRLFKKYCELNNTSMENVRFFWDGQRIHKHNTVEWLQNKWGEDNQTIEVFPATQRGPDPPSKRRFSQSHTSPSSHKRRRYDEYF